MTEEIAQDKISPWIS